MKFTETNLAIDIEYFHNSLFSSELAFAQLLYATVHFFYYYLTKRIAINWRLRLENSV